MNETRRSTAVRWFGQATPSLNTAHQSGLWLLRLVSPLAQPALAGVVALVIYGLRAAISRGGLQHTESAYFNYLADAFLHRQTYLRLIPDNIIDLVHYQGNLYCYWPPFPAIILLPFVAIWGVTVSDVLLTVVLGALAIALFARLLATLDATGIAPLSVERRGILVVTVAFGTVLLILAPSAGAWHTAQIIGLICVLLAAIAALTRGGSAGYFLAGVALACAAATRNTLIFNGIWLAGYLLWRDRQRPLRWRLRAMLSGCLPIVVTIGLLAWYNASRFGSPLETGLSWQIMTAGSLAEFQRFGQFNIHYIPRNLYYHFLGYTLFTDARWNGGGLFWMTPILLGAPYAVWRDRRQGLTWLLVLSCFCLYVPIALYMSPGGLIFGPRYLLDLFVPLIVLTARGVRVWRLDILQVLMVISCATYVFGSILWRLAIVTW